MSDEFTFLGFSAFDTTAFCTAVLVAAYSLISNPTGRQSGEDQAEYQVYSSWRLAVLAILGQIILMIVVIAEFSGSDVPSNAKGWLIALMLAPWAPVAGKVRETLSSGLRVRRMMKSRVTRNEIAATIRDRFKFGQRGIALPSVIFHASKKLPGFPVTALEANAVLRPMIKEIREQAKAAAQTEKETALDVGALWVMNQSLQPSHISKRRLFFWRIVSIIDPVARLWTTRYVKLRADPMPGITRITERARYLDITDALQQGGTISDELMERGMKKFCERCRLATRGAVEAFMESSERGHTDLRAGLWLKNINIGWAGNFERAIDVMWEAAFMDGKAAKVGVDREDESKSYGDLAKMKTVQMLALLFLIIRSLMEDENEDDVYAEVAKIVADGPFTEVWWERYWTRLEHNLVKKDLLGSVNDQWRKEFKQALRDVINEDFENIINEFLVRDVPIEHVCADEECFLQLARIKFSLSKERKQR